EATTTDAGGYAAIVRDFAAKRALKKIGADLAAAAQNSPVEATGQELIEAAETQLLDARAAGPQSHLSGMAAADASDWMMERIQALRT
ncbi:hypothetical protein ACHWGL_31770, partial [Klebsiella pneumoniae]|uniref:hypothetical protein n=1 Tax=Klebsiella pneumoniae TaxID=573 RepID=UPI00376F0884